MRAFLLALLATTLPPLAAHAQSVSPPIAQYKGNKARGSFVLSNQTLYPLTVVLQPRGFEVNADGDLADLELDTTRIQLKLSSTSFRLQPRQSYTVFYEVAADSVPTWFNIWSGVTGAKTEGGINLRIELPHVVYLNQKERLREEDIAIRSVRYDPAGHIAVVEMENLSPRLGRAETVTLSVERGPKAEAAGFPMFPGSIRRVRVPWADSIPPGRAEVRFDGFRLTTSAITADSNAVR